MACAALFSDLFKPFLIVKRSLNVDKFLQAGLRDNIDVVLSQAEGTTMTTTLFLVCACKHHVQTLRRNYTHDAREQVGILAVSALHQAMVLINAFNSFRKLRLEQQWNAQRRNYIEICHESFIEVLEAIEADKLLLKYTVTKQTKIRAKKSKRLHQ
ncbi:MAG: hypothetical protein EZS28_019731 [Streblomastix strix]|uniref:Uncharacterized protein n=1 Tax=Streblomastix strix TaxID=222440 RepID=A0A5J4VQI7_9EUKA|nr:MAG: hypothetical protein EZS28_019731 [Streblomastix strix]